MAKPKVPLSVIIICIIFAVMGVLWGSHAAGLVDLKPILSDLPVVGSYFQEDVSDIVEISPLEDENLSLQEENKELLANIVDLQGLESKLQDEISSYKILISQLEEKIRTLESKKEGVGKIAEYYSKMKPKEIAPIFDNLNDEKVVEILGLLDSGQTAKILAELEPVRAAKLTNLLTDIN